MYADTEMAQEQPDDIFLTAPLKLSKLIDKMATGEATDTALSPEEARLLFAEVTGARKGNTQSYAPPSAEFVPPGEGNSGERQVPTVTGGVGIEHESVGQEPSGGEHLETQSKPEYEDETGSGFGSCSDQADNDEDPSEPVHVSDEPSESAGVASFTDTKEYDQMLTSIDEVINERVNARVGPIENELTRIRLELNTLQRTVVQRGKELANLKLSQQEKKQTTTIGPSTPTKPQQQTGQQPKLPSDGKNGSHAKQPSVTDLGITSPGLSHAAAFLLKNPVYPKVAVVRKIKLMSLAKDMGFVAPVNDIGPDGWTEEGLLKLLTHEGKRPGK